MNGEAIDPILPTTEEEPIPMCRITVGKTSGPCNNITHQALLTANFPSNAKVTLKTVVFDGMTASVDNVIKSIKKENSFFRPKYLSAIAVNREAGSSTSPDRKNVM
jgi:hypothetical protein